MGRHARGPLARIRLVEVPVGFGGSQAAWETTRSGLPSLSPRWRPKCFPETTGLRPGSPRRLNNSLQIGIFRLEFNDTLSQ